MKIQVNFTIPGILGSVTHDMIIDKMDDVKIKKQLNEELQKEWFWNKGSTTDIKVGTIFFIKELTC